MTEDPSGRCWLLTRKALRELCADAGARAVLAAGRVFEIVPSRRAGHAGRLATTPTASFGSYRAMAAAEGPPTLGALLYDPEHWAFTPPDEQSDVEGHVRLAAALARARGLVSIAAPAVTLTRVLGRGGRRQDRYQAYLDLGIAHMAAPADVVDVQAQNAVRETGRYERFVRGAAEQVRAANPAATVLAGLSTNPPGEPVDGPMLERAMRATAATVSGWWLNVPSPGPHCPTCNPPRPDIAITALRAVFG